MTEAQQFEFKKWYLVASGTEKSYTRYELAELAWEHQQQRIDELESKLKIVVDALTSIAVYNGGLDKSYSHIIEDVANDALKQIEATS